jgi:7-cyano-7-deazaguanine synthase in queuosine biosynthesis
MKNDCCNSAGKAVVLLSGGLDSATTLFFARSRGFAPACLIFDYGQRHSRELRSARKVARRLRVLRDRQDTFAVEGVEPSRSVAANRTF